MQKFIRILMLLAVTMLAGSNVWAQDDPGNGEGNPLGVIYYDDQDATVTTAGGMLEFFNNDACDFDSEGNYQISANENVPLEWLDADRLVYIKATPNPGHTLGTADAEGAVTFISVTVWEATIPSGARQMTRGDGDEDETAIPVYAVDGQRGVYMFQMPADGSNVLVEAQFPLKAKLGDPGYDHIQFIDYEADPTTGEMTAVTRSTEELGLPVYVLDGTETMLGTPGEVEDEDNITEDDFTEAWYVCLATANGGNGLAYIALSGKECALELADYCKIHLILTDGCQMAVSGPEEDQGGFDGNVGASLTVYGQGGTDATNQSTEGVLLAESDGNAIFLSGDLTINGGQICFRSENGTAISNNQSAIAIRGGTVQAEGTSGISSEGNVTISGGEVNAIGASDAIFTSSDGVTISGGIVNAIGGDRGIALDEGVLTISGGEVNVGGEVNASDENDMSYGIYSASTPTTENGSTIVISDGTVNAFGATAIFAAGDLDISGGTVTAIGDDGDNDDDGDGEFGIESGGSITISGGTVKASSDAEAIYSSGNVEISGGTVEASAIFALNDITLGWTATDDYIMAGSYETATGAVTTAAGCRFVALGESAGEGLPTATAIVPGGATAHTPAEEDDGFNVDDIAGQTLRPMPMDGYLLELCPGLRVDLENSEDPALAFTMTKDGMATHYYIYKGGEDLTLSVGGVNDGFNGTDYNDAYVEILQENPTDPTAMPTAYTGFREDDHTMTMPDEDLKIVAYRAYGTNVGYLMDGSAKTPIQVHKAYILDGHDHTLYGNYDLTEGLNAWYVLEATAKTSGWMKDGNAWILTDDGNMFECRGHLGIILADGSALCVGEDNNEFTGGGAVIKSDGILKFYTQSVPKQEKDADGHVTHTDNRGRMEIYTYGADAIRAADDITLSNVRLKAQGTPAASQTASSYDVGLVYTEGALNLIGGQISVAGVPCAFYSKSHTYLDWMLTTDEIYGNIYHYGGVTYAGGKMFVDKESPSLTFSADQSILRAPSGFTLVGAVNLYSAKTGSGSGSGSGGGGSSSGGGTNNLFVSNSEGPVTVVQPGDGPQPVLAMVTGFSASGEIYVSELQSNVIPSSESPVLVTNGSNLKDTPSGKQTLGNTGALGDVNAAGVGGDNDLLATSGHTSEALSRESLQTLTVVDGTQTVGEEAADAYTREIVRQADNLAEGGEKAEEARQQLATYGYGVSATFTPADINALRESAHEVGRHKANLTLTVTLPPRVQDNKGGIMYHYHVHLDGSVSLVARNIGGGTKSVVITVNTADLARKRSSEADQPGAMFVPVDYDPDEVPAKGEIRLFMLQSQLLAMAIYQREHPEEVAEARRRGSLMIDTMSPETTTIIGRLMVTEQAQPGDEYWYSLDGRRLPSAPTAKGVYVHRGRKVVIR